jgi:LPPG:FO 2-phospho-L-lactate transferase
MREFGLNVVALAGGVGGAKLVDGLAALLPPSDLSIIVNTGDDFAHLGLQISPDLDTVCYTLAGIANPKTGWGQRDETWKVLEAIKNLDGPGWFRIGDKDIATHLIRSSQLAQGKTLSQITRELCRLWGVEHPVFPMSDDPVRTIVHTAEHGALAFQNYFVEHACQPVVKSFEFQGIELALPAPGAIKKIEASDLVIFTPSNPWVSIDPILVVSGYREAIQKKPVIAISPIIGGQALKGPAAKMYRELGIAPTASAVADHYRGLLTGFIFDQQDHDELEKIERWRIIPMLTDIIMKDKQDRIRFAGEVLEFADLVLQRSH